MTLLDVESALALLFTDSALRAEFEAHAVDVCKRFTLSPAESAWLRALDRRQIARYANSLRGKRRGTVCELIPATMTLLGARAPELFGEYVDAHCWPGRGTGDALGFLSYVRGRREPGSCLSQDVMRCEEAMLGIQLGLANESPCWERRPIHPGVILSRTSRMVLLVVDYDLEALYPCLARGEEFVAEREPSFVLVGRARGSMSTRIKRINEASARLIDSCDGARALESIVGDTATLVGIVDDRRGTFAAEAAAFLDQLLADGLLATQSLPASIGEKPKRSTVRR